MNTKLKLILILFFVPWFVININANSYQVKNAGEIKSKLNLLAPGDTLIMQNGVWNNQEIIFEAEGTENDSIVLKAETPGFVILNGRSNLRIKGKYLKVDGLRFVGGYSPSGAVIEFRNGSSKAYHSRLTNTAIVNYNPSNKDTDYKWVSIYGENNRVDHCFFENKLHSGTTLVVWVTEASSPNYHLIDHNYFGERPDLGYNGGETIRVGDSGNSMYNSRTTVEFNYFEHCDGEIEIISNKSDENIYRHNTFYECAGMLTLRHGDSCSVYNNFFIGNNKPLTGGTRIIGAGHKVYNNYFADLAGGIGNWHAALTIMNGVPDSPLNRYFQVDSAYVAFNTFVNCANTFYIGTGKSSELSLPPQNSIIANNVVFTDHQVITYEDTPQNFTWEGNIIQGSSLGIDKPDGINLQDPKLILASDGLWRPDVNSPVIGAAVGEHSLISNDIDGQTRSEIKDAGADQVSNDDIIYKPLTPSDDVGPAWMKTTVPVSINIQTIGTGSVTFEPAGGVYEIGTVVTLTAMPAINSTFAGWSGDTTTVLNPITVVVNKEINLTVNFIDPTYYNLSLWIIGNGNIELTPNQTKYLEGTQVIINAIADPGWIFSKWGGNLSGNTNPDTIIINSNVGVTVTFDQTTSIKEDGIPTNYKLEQNYPNPFNPSTTFSFSLKESSHVKLTILDLLGNEVKILIDRFMGAGKYKLLFNAENLTSGVYFYSIETQEFTSVKKMLLIK